MILKLIKNAAARLFGTGCTRNCNQGRTCPARMKRSA